MEHLIRLCNVIHKEIEVLEDQQRDGRSRIRSRSGPIGSKPCSWLSERKHIWARRYHTCVSLWIRECKWHKAIK